MSDIITFKPKVRKYMSIRNRSTQPNQPYKQDVPVLANHHIRKRMQNEWSVRALFEFRRSSHAFFLSLTYNEEHLPRLNDGRKAFCPDHISKFIRSIKDKLAYDYEIEDVSKIFKFISLSEYGCKRRRPHYHLILYFNYPVLNNFLLYNYLKKLITQFWPYGFFDLEVPRDGAAVVSYVTKYVTKDMFSMPLDASKDNPDYFEEHEEVVGFYKVVPKRLRPWSLPTPPVKKKIVRYTRYNFHRQSLGFGDNVLDYLTREDYLRGYFIVYSGPLALKYAIPKYARDRVLRNLEPYFDETGKKRYLSKKTELGELVHKENLSRISDMYNDFIRIYSSENECRKFTDKYGFEVFPEVFNLRTYYNQNKSHSSRDIREDFRFYITELRNFACFPYKYSKDPQIHSQYYESIFTVDEKICLSCLNDDLSYSFIDPLGNELNFSPVDISKCDKYKEIRPRLWNDFYEGYESLIRIIDDMQMSIDWAKQRQDEYHEFLNLINKSLKR